MTGSPRFLSHRVAVLYLGAIVEQAEAEALFARPLHSYSVGLLDRRRPRALRRLLPSRPGRGTRPDGRPFRPLRA